MGVFEHFPYTNFHELNLDFLLRTVKEWVEKTEIYFKDNDEAIKYIKANFEDLKNYVMNYFDSLDLQKEVSDKLDQMLADGELENLLSDKVVTWGLNWGNELSGEAVARERYNFYENPLDEANSRTKTMQNAIIYSPSGNYSNDGSQKYMYYWECWNTNLNTILVTYDLSNQRVLNRLEVPNGGHGGEMTVKDDKLYSMTKADDQIPSTQYVIIFDLTNPSAPVIESNTLYTGICNHLLGYDNVAETWLGVKSGTGNREVYRIDDTFQVETYLYDLESNTRMIGQDYQFDPVNRVIYSAYTWPNIIQINDYTNGKIITTMKVPNMISYINTGELEWLFASGEHLYFGGICQNGCRQSIQVEYNSFYSNAKSGNSYERHINFITAGQRSVTVNRNADPLNRTFAQIGGNNLVFRYIEDAFNYIKDSGNGIITLTSDYDYSFHILANCRLNLGNYNHGAIIVDHDITCVITTLGGDFVGNPIKYTYTRGEQSQDITCYLYTSHGSRVTISSISNIPENSNADIMCWFNYSVINIISNTAITNSLITDSQLFTQGWISKNVHSKNSFLSVRGVDIREGLTQYIDLDSKMTGSILTTPNVQSIALNTLTNKYYCKPAILTGGSGAALNGRALGPVIVFGANTTTYTIAWGYWSADTTFTRVNYKVAHSVVNSPLAFIEAHRWYFEPETEFPSPIASYGFLGSIW